MRRALAFLCCLLVQPALALTAAQEMLLFGGHAPIFYINSTRLSATSPIPTGLTYSSAGPRYYWDPTGTLQVVPNNQISNSTNAGAVAGSPGTMPTGWYSYTSATRCSRPPP